MPSISGREHRSPKRGIFFWFETLVVIAVFLFQIESEALRIVSYIGLAISLACLLLTIIFFISFGSVPSCHHARDSIVKAIYCLTACLCVYVRSTVRSCLRPSTILSTSIWPLLSFVVTSCLPSVLSWPTMKRFILLLMFYHLDF